MTKRGKLFLLDDDELITSMLARSLSHAGYEVLPETNAKNVITKIADWNPDLVLLDMQLDESVTGLDILAQIKELKLSCAVVMLSADDSEESASKAKQLGAADYLTKPFNIEDVKMVILNVLDKRCLAKELDADEAILVEETDVDGRVIEDPQAVMTEVAAPVLKV